MLDSLKRTPRDLNASHDQKNNIILLSQVRHEKELKDTQSLLQMEKELNLKLDKKNDELLQQNKVIQVKIKELQMELESTQEE